MKLSRVRVAFQVFIHALLVGHVLAYYFLDWRRIGALDFQAFFHHLLGKGLLTAGAVLAIIVYGTALVFGRLFCSWGCHFGATQDLAAWILRRLGWKPPLVRTRFLHQASYLVLFAIFVIPVAERLGRNGWGPFQTDLAAVAPWDTLPGWFFSVVTYLACGAGVLLFLGTRGFCRFACPYGALFRITDRVARFRVRRVAPCGSHCGSGGAHPCTASCPTAIDVHRETSGTGRVTSTDCVRCNLCVEACPSHALAHVTASTARARMASSAVVGLAEPGTSFRPIGLPLLAGAVRADDRGRSIGLPLLTGAVRADDRGRSFDLPLWGEIAVLAVGIAAYLAADLVYGGHFLVAVLALGEGFLAFWAVRAVVGGEGATILGWPLRRGRSWTLLGVTVAGAFALSLIPLFEAGAFKWLRAEGLRLDPLGPGPDSDSSEPDGTLAGPHASDAAITALPPPARARLELAADRYRRALEYFPSDNFTRRLLLSAYVRLGDPRAVGEAAEIHRRSGDEGSRELLEWVRGRFLGARGASAGSSQGPALGPAQGQDPDRR